MTAQTYTEWRKSTRSDQGNCVEVARADNGGVGVRDSKDTGPVLEFTATSWAAFSNAVGARTDDRGLTPRD